MAHFVLNQPIATSEPVIKVDGDLPVGTHRFQLEVITADGRKSGPDIVAVRLVEIEIPTHGPVPVG